MKNHTFNIVLDRNPPGVHKIAIPVGYRENIEPGDTIDEYFKVIGRSKVNANQVIISSQETLLPWRYTHAKIV